MDLGGSLGRLVKAVGRWLYCWLRIFICWLGKLSGKGTIRIRLWWFKGKQKKFLAQLGEKVYELYQKVQTMPTDDAGVQEILQALETAAEKREKLQALLQELDDQYRENVARIRSKPSSPVREAENHVRTTAHGQGEDKTF